MTTLLTEDEREEIRETLLKKCPNYACSVCNGNKLTLFDHLDKGPVIDFWAQITSTFSQVPSITILCNNCGFMGKHAIGALGLMHLYKDPFDKKEESK